MHRSLLVATLLGVVGLTGCGSKKEKEEEKSNKVTSLSYIPEDAVFVVVVRPQRMLKAPMFAHLQDEDLAALTGEDNKFDIRQVEQMVVYMTTSSDGGFGEAPTLGGAVLRFESAQDPAQLADQMFGAAERQEVGGISAYVNSAGVAALAAVDEKTCLIAPPSNLPKMFKAKSATGPAVEKLRELSNDSDIVGAFVMSESLRTMAGDMLDSAAQGGGLPPEFKDAGKIPPNLQTATFAVDLSKEQFLHVAVEMKDEASSATLKQLVEKGLELVKFVIGVDIRRFRDVQPELAELQERILNQLFDSITLTQEGNRVVATADMPDEMGETMIKAVAAARKAARLMERRNDLKQVGVALLNYHDGYRNLPPAPNGSAEGWFDKDGKPHLSWRVHILPFFGESQLYDQFRLDEPWDSEHNIKLLSQIPDVFKSKTKDPTLTTMLMVSGKGLAYEGGAGQRIASFSDGTARTVIVVDVGADKAVPWTKPVDMSIDPENPLTALGQTDEPGFLALRVDASVLTIPKDIDPAKLWALFTRSGNDSDEPDDF